MKKSFCILITAMMICLTGCSAQSENAVSSQNTKGTSILNMILPNDSDKKPVSDELPEAESSDTQTSETYDVQKPVSDELPEFESNDTQTSETNDVQETDIAENNTDQSSESENEDNDTVENDQDIYVSPDVFEIINVIQYYDAESELKKNPDWIPDIPTSLMEEGMWYVAFGNFDYFKISEDEERNINNFNLVNDENENMYIESVDYAGDPITIQFLSKNRLVSNENPVNMLKDCDVTDFDAPVYFRKTIIKDNNQLKEILDRTINGKKHDYYETAKDYYNPPYITIMDIDGQDNYDTDDNEFIFMNGWSFVINDTDRTVKFTYYDEFADMDSAGYKKEMKLSPGEYASADGETLGDCFRVPIEEIVIQ